MAETIIPNSPGQILFDRIHPQILRHHEEIITHEGWAKSAADLSVLSFVQDVLVDTTAIDKAELFKIMADRVQQSPNTQNELVTIMNFGYNKLGDEFEKKILERVESFFDKVQ